MGFSEKIVSCGTISEFMNMQREKEAAKTPILNKSKTVKKPFELIPFATFPILAATKTAFASAGAAAVPVVAATGDLAVRVSKAFDPLVDMCQAFSIPIALTCAIGGAIYIMIGNSEKGTAMIQKAALGFVLVQTMPFVFKIFVSGVTGVL